MSNTSGARNTSQLHLHSSLSTSAYLVKVEDQIQFAHIAEELIQHFDEEMDSLEVGQLVVIGIHADTEE